MRSLTTAEARLLGESRTAVLATIDPAGRPRLMPICFAVGRGGNSSPAIYTPIDDKPKISPEPHRLARVRDIAARPEVSLLVQHWDEDWTRLAWLRLRGTAELVEPDDPAGAISSTPTRSRLCAPSTPSTPTTTSRIGRSSGSGSSRRRRGRAWLTTRSEVDAGQRRGGRPSRSRLTVSAIRRSRVSDFLASVTQRTYSRRWL
jgi:Pyridoxamine 5''-phosphate oxidase.